MTGTTGTEPAWDEERGYACCGGYREHGHRCEHRAWPATATPEVRRTAVRGDCIAPAHARIEDLHAGLLGVHGLDCQQRKQLTEILAQVWDDGFGYGQQVRPEPYACGACGCAFQPDDSRTERDGQTFHVACGQAG
jgi:hypothetical protein